MMLFAFASEKRLIETLILIFNQPTDKSSAEISPFFVKLPCRAASPPAVAFLD